MLVLCGLKIAYPVKLPLLGFFELPHVVLYVHHTWGHLDTLNMSATPGPCPQIDKQRPAAPEFKETGVDDFLLGKQTTMRTVAKGG